MKEEGVLIIVRPTEIRGDMSVCTVVGRMKKLKFQKIALKGHFSFGIDF